MQASINPFSFVQLFTRSYPRALKQLVSIATLQCFLEGRCLTETHQMWMRNNIHWDNDTIVQWIIGWGTTVTVCGLFVAPFLLRRLSAPTFTAVTNLSIAFGQAMWGFACSVRFNQKSLLFMGLCLRMSKMYIYLKNWLSCIERIVNADKFLYDS